MNAAPVEEPSLFRKTVRTVAILAGACVLFLALLSATSLFLVQRALGTATVTEPALPKVTPPSKPAQPI